MSARRAAKVYDRSYFDHWYREQSSRIESPAALRRRVALAVAMAERFLERPLRSALDIGCGEGRWRKELRHLRPKLRYRGIEPSSYAVGRFGKRRDIVQGSFADLARLDLGRRGPFDLVICADVLHYLDGADIEAGLPALVEATGGLAYLELLTAEDEIEGDRKSLKLRPSSFYQQLFSRAGLKGVGCHGWLGPDLADLPAALERS